VTQTDDFTLNVNSPEGAKQAGFTNALPQLASAAPGELENIPGTEQFTR